MHRVALARMAHGQREVVVLRPRPDVLALRAARLVVDIEARRRGDVLRHHDAEVLLAVALLARLGVVHADERPLGVVERHVLHVVGIRVVGTRKHEVKELRPPEVVQRQRSLPERALRDVAHILAVERIVDPVVGQHRVERPDLHAVVVAPHVPHEVVERADRIAEEVRFERLADLPLLLGRVLRLLPLGILLAGLLVGVAAVEVRRLAALLGTHQVAGIEVLRTQCGGSRQAKPDEQHQQYAFRQWRHVNGRKTAAKVIKIF